MNPYLKTVIELVVALVAFLVLCVLFAQNYDQSDWLWAAITLLAAIWWAGKVSEAWSKL